MDKMKIEKEKKNIYHDFTCVFLETTLLCNVMQLAKPFVNHKYINRD